MGEQTTERLQIGGAIVASLALFYAACTSSFLNAVPFFALGLLFNLAAVTYARSRGVVEGRRG